MSTLKSYTTILDLNVLNALHKKNVRTVFDFLQETPDNICKVTNLHFREVLDIKNKLLDLFRGKLHVCDQLYKEIKNIQFELLSGVVGFDNTFGPLKLGNVYELCGKSAVGKTQLCLLFAANVAVKEKCAYYIDTKGDFSAKRVVQLIRQKFTDEKIIVTCLERIRVTRVFNLYQIISCLHWLKTQLIYDYIPLIIIDSITASYFSTANSEKPFGLALLNHIASLVKYIALEYRSIILITNLATDQFTSNDESVMKKTSKTCLGKSWYQMCDMRFHLHSKNDLILVTSDKNSHLDNFECNFHFEDI